MLYIYTPYGDTYTVDEQGNISREGSSKSGQWKMLGLLPTNCSNFFHAIPFNRITPEWLKSHSLAWKNGNPRYTVIDLDYGTTRVWGNTKVHGIRSMWFEG